MPAGADLLVAGRAPAATGGLGLLGGGRSSSGDPGNSERDDQRRSGEPSPHCEPPIERAADRLIRNSARWLQEA